MTAARAVVVTDLDGTLLDHATYRPGPALARAHALIRAGIPVIACSAKTRAEQRVLVAELGLTPAYVVENGGALVVWDGFPAGPPGPERVIRLGLDYAGIRQALRQAAGEAGVTLTGYGDVDATEVAERTGLDLAAAGRAQAREHGETFWIESGDPERLRAALGRRGARMMRGSRFWTAQGPHDKGTAVRHLLALFPERPVSYGLGDAPNDLEMLAAVDHPMVVEGPDGGWADLDVPGLTRLAGRGPEGWVRGADRVLDEQGVAG